MGRGDKKSRKGKIWRGSYGVSRSRRAIKLRFKRTTASKKAAAPVAEPVAAKPKKTGRKKATEAS